ncbi:MAG: CehA/McbA family metallohydrolase [Acutalibacteraceae bacterium]
MNEIIIKHRIEKQNEGKYYTIPFEVPERVESLTVRYQYDKRSQGLTGQSKKANIVDLGLINSDGHFVGWSGSSRESVTVAQANGTQGYFAQKIKSGTWQIIVGAYKVAGDYTDVVYTITFKEKQKRLYYGDLHIHTVASDGEFSAYEIGLRAKKIGLDFVATADHNNFSENFSLPKIDGVTFIPAVEWTHYKGHMNLFGVKAPFENSFVANTKEEMQSLLQQAKELGATVSVNHPKCPVCPYLWGDDDAFDMLEIWNGPMRNANADALQYWTQLLRKGRKIPIVGGSDYHRRFFPVRMGNPVTAVLSEEGDCDSLMKNIRQGHSFVTSSVHGVKLMIRCGEAMMGDTLSKAPGHVSLEIEAENLRHGDLVLVTAKGEKPIQPGSISVNTDEKFAYVKAAVKAFGREYFSAVTNPIYFE